MKTLLDCHKACRARVMRLNSSNELKQRLISFGIMKDVVLEVLEQAPRKSTIEVKVGKMRIALRADEAKLIEVEKI